MADKRRRNPEARRGELLAAARLVFGKKGTAKTAVGDIVKAAGVAQGTFYLYFDTKDDIVNAMVDDMADEMVDSIEHSVNADRRGAVAGISSLRDALLALVNDRSKWDLAEIYHRPENRAVHDRMAERLLPRLVPLVESIIKQGITEGVFTTRNPRASAWFILGGLHAMEVAFTKRAELSAAMTEAIDSAIRSLGYTGALRHWTPSKG